MKNIKVLLAAAFANLYLSSIVFAQAAAPATVQPPGLGEVFSRMMPMFAVVFFIFYFLVLKPQQSKLKAQQTLLESLKRGDQIVTTGGLIGRIAGTEKGYILLEIAPNTRIKVENAHIARRWEEGVEVLPSDKAKAQTSK
ncbi:MAG: preprotein translocase subunit YajC [Deltaproteobacteria bacterium]|nr:preprotein translocase subunit YajC [Deltaproteobacteria bacterium]